MKKVSQKQLKDHVNLVKWQETKKTQKFNLLTVHSLLLNSNQKFLQLKKKIENFNQAIDKGIDRKHLQYEYIKKLYQMMRQMVNIPIYQNQQQFLNNVYEWSNQGARYEFLPDQTSDGTKSRPTTATTRARPFSAYSRPKSGVQKINILKLEEPLQIKPQNKTKNNIDYEKLKPGEIQFYTGNRTLHVNQEKPKKLLKQYQRKIFYEEQIDSDVQIIDLKQTQIIQPFKPNNLLPNQQAQILAELQEGEQPQNLQNQGQNQENIGGQDDGGAPGEQDVNIDDLPIQGQGQQGQPQQVVDKLKPKLKAFIQHQTHLSKNKINYAGGMNQYIYEQNKKIRKNQQDAVYQQKMFEWAKQKSRTNRQQRRRAQSARIVTKKIGIGYAKDNQKLQQNVNIINFQDIPVPETKQIRPKTAFRTFNQVNRKKLIQNCFITGNIKNVPKPQNLMQNNQERVMRITSLAQKPKKKTFQQILRQAQQKVKQQEMEQILNVKEKFAKNKVPFQTNRIAKSVTYHAMGAQEEQYEQKFVGQITGMSMIKNPFFKVGKKKKKKKKAK